MLLYVDVIDACHLKCPTCVRGVRAFPNTSQRMPLDMFDKIIAKAKSDGAYRVGIFSWIEPFLCSNLHEYIEVVNKYSLPCAISSTLSIKNIKYFDECILGMERLTISISGFDQEIYQINHVGGNVEWVKNNIIRIGELKRRRGAAVTATLRMLMFDYNRDQEQKLRSFASDVGIGFEVLRAEGHPRNTPQSQNEGMAVAKRIRDFDANRQKNESIGKTCPLIFEHVTINAAGDVYQCTPYGNYESLRIGPFLELSREEILLRRYTHPICNSCTWARRPITPLEKVLMQQAMMSRLGDEIVNRVPQLSKPSDHLPITAEGYIKEKSRAYEDF